MAWSYGTVTINGKTYSQDTAVTLPAGTRYYSSADGKSASGTDTLSSAKTVYYYGYNDTYVGVSGYDPAPYYFCASAGGSPSGSGGWRYMKAADLPYATYTVSFNANGGSGAPNSQTKTYGTNLTLSSTKPTRTGYTFKCWNTKSDGSGTNYNAGASYASNSAATLYAIWTEHALTVNYYSNYATSAFDDALNTVGSDKNVKVYTYDFYYDNDYSEYGLANYSGSSGSVYMTRTGYTATGKWGTSASGGTLVDEDTGYSTGQALAKALGKDLSSGNASVNIYAQWEENVLTVNYYANQADYCTFKGEVVTINQSEPVLTKTYSYTAACSDGLANVQNTSSLYLSRTGYTPTKYWNTASGGSGKSVSEGTSFDTGQAMAVALGKTLESSSQSVNVYAQWRENILTVRYHSNYATQAIMTDNDVETEIEVSADTDVVVRTSEFAYDTEYPYGLHNYSEEGDGTYLARTRYDAVGYWGTTQEVYTKDDEGDEDGIISNANGIAVSEDNVFTSGQELAEAFGLTLEDGDKEIDLYAQWILRASMVTIYLPDENGDIVPQKGLVHIYDDKGDLHYGILHLYGSDGKLHMVI